MTSERDDSVALTRSINVIYIQILLFCAVNDASIEFIVLLSWGGGY